MIGLIEQITDSYIFGFEGFIVIAIMVGVSAYISNTRKKVGNTILIEQLKELDTEIYHHFSNVSLPELDQKIDHIVLSIYGVLIINQKNVVGTVYGSEGEEDWTIKKKKTKKMKNPLNQLKANIHVIAEQLKLKEKNIHTIACFSNTSELEVDPSLMKKAKVCHYDQIGETIQAYQTPKLAKTKVAELVEQLKETQ